MADDSAMGSLLAAVAVAAASSNTQTTSPPSPHPSKLSLPTNLPPVSIPNPQTALPPPPPPLPPPLPAPPPLPPMSIRRQQQQQQQQHSSIQSSLQPTTPSTEKRKGARIFTTDEKKILEANYSRNKFPARFHMETLANAMTKPTEKVRTWYNNRRALDRKLGLHVNRNQPYQPHPAPAYSTTSPPIIADDTVILPTRHTRPTSSPPSRSHQLTPTTPNPNHSKPSPQPCRKHHFLDLTPTSATWTPSISPVTTARNSQVPASSSPSISTPRFRTSPLRMRNVRLQISSQQVCGEIPGQSLDNGLEVKFLFGKKRIVYEWYCGPDYADAQNTGGPYAKMEMSFATISAMEHVQQAPTSILIFSFSVFPTLFLQTPESMMKYKIRAQQRQYRKVGQEDFPIPVTTDQHRISMRTDEATRVLKFLYEDAPDLPFLSLAQSGYKERTTTSCQDHPHIPHSTPKPAGPYPTPFDSHRSTTKVSPAVTRIPFTVYDLHSKPHRNGQSIVSASRENQAVDGRSNATHDQREVIAGKFQALGNTTGHSSLCSPATPVVPPRRFKADHSRLISGKSQKQPSYIDSQDDKMETQDSAGPVRRELDFNHIFRQPASTPSAGVKRSEPETGSKESEAKLKARRKLTDWESSASALPTAGSVHCPNDLTSSLKSDIGDGNPSTDIDGVGSNRILSHSSILRVLPR